MITMQPKDTFLDYTNNQQMMENYMAMTSRAHCQSSAHLIGTSYCAGDIASDSDVGLLCSLGYV